MSSSDDEYDRQLGGLIKLTDEDCAAIDALTVFHASVPVKDSVVHVSLAPNGEETPTARSPPPKPKETNSWDTKLTPYQRFRPYARLSVTDLVAPVWCEVQFEYGLQQQRSKRIDKRPQSIVTRQGKEISVKKKTAELNDVVLREGHVVHSALEREIRPVAVQVRTTSLEEEWGLKLFNMLNDLETLLLIGKCREFPVMGFIKDQLVVGIIDEIDRLPLGKEHLESPSNKRSGDASAFFTPTKPKPKRSKSASESPSSDKQLTLHEFFPITPSKDRSFSADKYEERAGSNSNSIVNETSSRKTHTLYLIDHKTRLAPTLPQESATLSSRLQLMLYWRLLNALVSSNPPFDFHRLWKHLHVDPSRKFSRAFLSQLYPDEQPQAMCIQDLQDQWSTVLTRLEVEENNSKDSLGGSPVHQLLTIIYRRRAAGKRDRHRRIRQPILELSSEEKDLQAAILASLKQPIISTQDISVAAEIGNNAGVALNALEVSNYSANTNAATLVTPYSNGSQPDPKHTKPSDSRPEGGTDNPGDEFVLGSIIGKLQFQQDNVLLDEHLTRVLQWWYGERDPIGVSLENTDRCMTCEYADGCEWREQRAQEAQQILIKAKLEASKEI